MNSLLISIRNPTTRKIIIFALKAIVAVLVMMVLVNRISLLRLFSALHHAETTYIYSGFLLVFLNIYLQYLKWQIVVQRENRLVKKRHVLFSLFIGMALGLVTPGRLGDFGRTLFLKSANWATLLGLLMVDKLITLAVLYLIGIFGLAHFVSMSVHPFVWLPIFIMTFILICLFFLVLLRPEILRSIAARYHPKVAKYAAVDRFLTGIERATPHFTFTLLVLTVLQTATYCTQFYLLINAFTPISLVEGYTAVFAIMFTKSLLPISLGDLGVRESASIFFLGRFAVPEATAFNASFLLFLINILLPSAIGAILFLLNRQMNQKFNGSALES